MNTSDINHLCNFICTKPQKVVVVSHTSPDGDAIGSALAMQQLLIAYGHQTVVIIPDALPDYYSWLPGIDKVIVAEDKFDKAIEIIANATMQVIVDMNALNRAQNLELYLQNVQATRIMVDHHILTQNNFDAMYLNPMVSSTSELVYDIIEFLNPDLITKDVADCIYTGIVTDTANFFHGNMTDRTFEITAELMRRGSDIVKINQMLYHTFSENRIRLLGYSISERLHVIREHSAAYIFLTKEDLDRFHYSEGDSEDIVNYGLAINGIHVSAFFIERPEFIKISLRSEGDINVNAMATKYFSGGGHKNASGAHFYGPLNEAISLFEKALKEL